MVGLARSLLDVLQDEDAVLAGPAGHEAEPTARAEPITGVGQHTLRLHRVVGRGGVETGRESAFQAASTVGQLQLPHQVRVPRNLVAEGQRKLVNEPEIPI